MTSPELVEYLERIGAPPAVRSRTEELHGFYSAIANLDNATTVLSEVVAEDGSRDYQGLWIFTPAWVMEARFPNGETEELDGTMLRSLVRWVLKATKFDFRAATSDSRLTVELWFAGEIIGEIHASGENCEVVSSAIARYVTRRAEVATSPS